MKAVDFLSKYRHSKGEEVPSGPPARILKLSQDEMTQVGMGQMSPGDTVVLTVTGSYKSRDAEGCEIEVQNVNRSEQASSEDKKPPIVRLATEPKAG